MYAATSRGELAALVDALDAFDVESAAAAGIALDQLLWIRGHVVVDPGVRSPRDGPRPLVVTVDRQARRLSLVESSPAAGITGIVRSSGIRCLRVAPRVCRDAAG